MTFDEAMQILEALDREGVEYVLVGSMGMAAQGIVCAGRDVDLFVSPTAENVERLKVVLGTLFNDRNVEEISADDLAGEYPAISVHAPTREILARHHRSSRRRISLRTISIGRRTIEGIRVRVATPQQLYRMKKDTVRPQDKADASRLREVFELEED